MNDPYKVLNVSPSASDDEVKKAYRELARKYHPDNYQDNPLSDLASEKMKEINEAYDEIMRQRSGGGKSSGSNNRGYNNYNSYSNAGSGIYAQIRIAINRNRIKQAESMLNSIAQGDRGAEWNFLMGSVCYRKGWLDEARRYYQTACDMDPTNAEYAQALNYMNNGGTAYRPVGSQQGGMNACDCCSSLICADCCCECMGGDLISCC